MRRALPAGTTLQWTGPNGFTSTQANVGIPNATTAASGTYTLTVTSASLGCSVSASVTVSVDGVPAAPTTFPVNNCGPGALTLVATGGVYIAGGIVPRLVQRLDRELFLAAFRNKGRLSSLLEKVPVHIITNPSVGLLGAAAAAGRL
jgi:hypothetical protein